MTSFKDKLSRRLKRLLPRKQKKVLVYIGLFHGEAFDTLVPHYKQCFGIEANPTLAANMQARYADNPNVTILHAAASDQVGEATFHLSNNLAASSLGQLNEDWQASIDHSIDATETITVPTVHLGDYLEAQGIHTIDDYVSDIQGMDLTVLKTMQQWIATQRIGCISCETGKDDKPQIYADLPDNSLTGFKALLEPQYQLAATGWGLLQKGRFDTVPDDWWEMDCMWTINPNTTK